ncbi:MAG: DEAD/DEAH box helicase [bacterium]
MNTEELYEMLGVYTSERNIRPNMLEPQTLSHSYCAQLKPWQTSIVNQLRNGNDLFTIVAPGGGKTLPIICYWIQEILGINLIKKQSKDEIFRHLNNLLYNTTRIPKLAYLVPTRTLAQQTTQEIIDVYANLFTQLVNYRLQFWGQDTSQDKLFINWIQKNTRQNYNEKELGLTISQITDSINNPNNTIKDYNSSMIKTFKYLIIEAINNHINNNLIYIQTGGQRSQGNPNNSPVIITIYQSGNSSRILSSIKDAKLIVCDEAHLTQKVSVLTEDPSQAENIALSLYDILKAITGKKSQLVFLSGTQNPSSAVDFAEYLNKHFRRNFNTKTIRTTGDRNPANVNVIPDDSLTSQKGIVDNIVSNIKSNDWGNLYVVFSIKQLQTIIEESMKKLGVRNLSNIQNDSSSNMNFQTYMGKRETQYTSPTDIRLQRQDINKQHLQNSQQSNISKDARNIENKFLRECVSHGIGFIARNTPQERNVYDKFEMSESDKFIIASLFKDRKLKVLLATDAVGIGVNIDVKKLYIPSLEKFSGKTGRMESIILRDLSQILNRAGRGATPTASVITPSDNVQRVMLSLNLDPDSFESTDFIKKIPFNHSSFKVVYAKIYHGISTNLSNMANSSKGWM